MKKIRTASVRATTAEIEAEQNEKRQRNNSPRLTIVKIVLTHQTESNFTFKNAVCEQYNIENTQLMIGMSSKCMRKISIRF